MTRTVVGIGEVLWDLFPSGPRFGGAPANFACHAAALGSSSYVVSAVGTDELGRAAATALRDRGVDSGHVFIDAERPTGTVAVETDPSGKPRYEFAVDVAWDRIPWSEGLASLAARTDAVCFGTLGQRESRSRETIRRFVRSTPPECLRIFDVNVRPPFFDGELLRESLPLANVLKASDDELPVVASILDAAGSDVDIVRRITEQFGLRVVALTRGSRGAILLHEGRVYGAPGEPVAVRDTVGAGDAFAAALAMGMLRGDDFGDLVRRCVEVSAFVCTRDGATPQLPVEIREPFLA